MADPDNAGSAMCMSKSEKRRFADGTNTRE